MLNYKLKLVQTSLEAKCLCKGHPNNRFDNAFRLHYDPPPTLLQFYYNQSLTCCTLTHIL